jgi:23S rRNA (uracil1939-C5)-methyltransferase
VSNEFRIDRIGAEGDGVGTRPGGEAIHISRSLPGETVSADIQTGSRARLNAVLSPSPDRIEPPCPHFAHCGGCALQHWADAPYAAWKRAQIETALMRAGFDQPHVAPLMRTPAHARTRMVFTARRGAGLALGLHAQHARDIVDISDCVVLHPTLLGLVAPLRSLLNSLTGLRREAVITANLLTSGADLLVRADAPAATADRTKLAAFSQTHKIGRIAWAVAEAPPETAAALFAPAQDFGGISCTVPPGAFLQASAEGARAIVEAVIAGLPGKLTAKSRVIELYAGCGTISFPLSRHARVRAIEGDHAAFVALRHAATGTRVEALHRDLVRQPLQAKEFTGAAAIVLDPPFAGAAAQMPAIAASKVERVIYVSCNPAALARDAKILREAGYQLALATPIDQFFWSAQIETVAVFTHGPIGGR